MNKQQFRLRTGGALQVLGVAGDWEIIHGDVVQ